MTSCSRPLDSTRDCGLCSSAEKPGQDFQGSATIRAGTSESHGAIIRLWENEWEEFTPFLSYDVEIRTVICSTNAIESLNARYRRAVRALGPLPGPLTVTALKCLYLVTRSLDPTGSDRTRWTVRWKPALNAFATDFAERWPAAGTY